MKNSGRRWAYFGVLLGFSASITANIASTVLKSTEVSLWLRVPFAIFWPLATYVAIEVLVRIDWSRSWSHRLVRLVLAGPVGLVAAFVSYLHQHHLMVLAGEPGLAQGFGPLAVDGMLFGMTAALIVTRVRAEQAPAIESMTADEALEKWVDEPATTQPIEPGVDWDAEFRAMENEDVSLLRPISPSPVSVSAEMSPLPAPVSSPPASPRAPRLSWDARKVTEMILDGEKNPVIISATGAPRISIDRFRAVIRLLQADRTAAIDPAKKVNATHVQMIRELVSK